MEKVKVIKTVPGVLEIGDVLVSPEAGADFILDETNVSRYGSNERYVSLDYITVSENIPEFFIFEEEELPESECYFCGDCTGNCNCVTTAEELNDLGITYPFERSMRTEGEIQERYDFFASEFDRALPGSEEQVVYKNLMWFIEWLRNEAELV